MDSDSAGSEAEAILRNGTNSKNYEEDPASDGLDGADDADLFGDGSEIDEEV